jgi:hypothetical protein
MLRHEYIEHLTKFYLNKKIFHLFILPLYYLKTNISLFIEN